LCKKVKNHEPERAHEKRDRKVSKYHMPVKFVLDYRPSCARGCGTHLVLPVL
jgi:hypothetical protein